jgi:hypothetical protein
MNQEPERKFYLKHFRAISLAIATYDDFTLLVNHLVEGLCRIFALKGASIMLQALCSLMNPSRSFSG